MSKHFLSELTGSFATPALENPTGVMMEAAYQNLGLDWRYINCEIQPDDLKNAVLGAKAMNWRGFNCSIPHKVSVIAHLDDLGESARIIGAVNTVVNRDGKLIGENTDGRGFVESVKSSLALANKRVVLFGAGGAARAVAVELALAGVAHIIIVNRNQERGQELASLVAENTPADAEYHAWTQQYQIPAEADLVINVTSIGLFPNVDAELDIDTESIKSSMVVADGIFNPPETRLIQTAKSKGCTTVNGLGMLVQQGVIAFEYWTGKTPSIDVMKAALSDALDITDLKSTEK
ncbi:shikimate dehydrogenase [Marinomonas sp. M1K-6]|uniref:Shikimate dehydrogenase (NADP(+)) n=1 Tax=Marinomonas profundi TaxID=2726122 RepID=A0A847R7I2_9GAMM|nr:shikimate dehydrogenase [Marinomonas profundi]NLQ17067.1 shikimate dehydrogenase [Marinomonas profundi]UDV04732.1 shikimate dehydrogenase [Marinomonas profundi]